MAAVIKSHAVTFATANDTIPGKIVCNGILIVSGAAGGATTLQSEATTFFTQTFPADTREMIHFASPQVFEDLKATAVGTNVVITVFIA